MAVGVVDARGGVGTAIAPVRVRDGIGVVGIRAQAAEILAVCGDDLRGRGGIGIRGARGGKWTAECAVGIVDAGGTVGAAERTEFVRRGVGEEGVRAELAEEDAVAADLCGGA